MRMPRMNDNPACSIAFWLAAEIIPASATTVYILEAVGGHERLEGRQHRGGFGLVALERIDHQRETGGVGEQPDGDLRLQPALFGEPRFPKPVTGIGLEIQSAH